MLYHGGRAHTFTCYAAPSVREMGDAPDLKVVLWNPLSETFEAAAEALAQDFAPLSDWRASAGYRMLSAQNLLRRFFLEQDAGTAAPAQLAIA